MSGELRLALRQAVGGISSLCIRPFNAVTIGVRAVVFDDAGRVFLVKHSYMPGWYLPGGGVEIGETLLAALARELSEEGNITLAETPQIFAIYLNRNTSRRDHVALYIVRSFHQEPPTPNREIIGHGFFATDSLPHDSTPATRARIREVLGRQTITEIW
jgi:ADP-ribose pyrophosphatase YjhB (NUDIX family)